jgi:hypothetical protein
MALGRKTGGRRKGTPNKVTAARQAMLPDTAARVMAGRSGGFPGDAHALLVAIYRDESLPLSMRLDAAKSAVKFERPALASTMVTQKDALDELSLDDLQRLLALAEAARAAGGRDALTAAAGAAQRAVIEQQTSDQLPLLVGPVAA